MRTVGLTFPTEQPKAPVMPGLGPDTEQEQPKRERPVKKE